MRACFCTSSASAEFVQVESRGAVQLIALNRPAQRNAVNSTAARQLHHAFAQFESDSSCHVAVLHGVGGTFCAGYDLKEVAEAREGFELPKNVRGGVSPMVSYF